MLQSQKFSDVDLSKKLIELGWKGRKYGISNRVTFLSETNQTLAVVDYDNTKSIIISAKFF